MAIVGSLPFNLQNNTPADATQVMADFNTISDGVNANAAKNGVNSDITQLAALTTPLTRAQGGSQSYIATATSTGSANAQTIAATVPALTLATGAIIQFVPGFTNTGPTTLNVAASGVFNVMRQTGAGLVALSGGELVLGSFAIVVYDGTQFQLLTNQNDGVPPGTVFWSAGAAAPSGYLLLSGQAISRTTYAALFLVLGTTYGTGDGSTTFNVPDVRGRMIYSVDAGANRINFTTGGGVLKSTPGNQFILQGNFPSGNLTGVSATFSTLDFGGTANGMSSNTAVGAAQAGAGINAMVGPSNITLTGINLGGSSIAYSPPAIVLTAIMKY